MTQQPVEIILLRQLSTYMSIPVFIVDPNGSLLFFNSPAELILGKKFIDCRAMPKNEWTTIFQPLDDKGELIPPEQLPLSITLMTKRQAHGKIFITGLDKVTRKIEVYSFPLINLADEYLGAMALFWEAK